MVSNNYVHAAYKFVYTFFLRKLHIFLKKIAYLLRAVVTSDFMTAHWAELPYELLGKVSNRIINEVRGINRVVYDISGKPPATIEWE